MLGLVTIISLFFWRQADLTHILIIGAFTILSLRYHRAVGAFAIAVTPIIGYYMGLTHIKATRPNIRRVYFGIIFLSIIVMSVFIASFKFIQPWHFKSFGYRVVDELHPVTTARFIEETGIKGNMYNRDRFGGYLSYKLYPERKIFMYSHSGTFGHIPKLIHSGEYLEKYDITYAIVGDSSEMSILLSKGFVPVFWEPSAALLLKDIPQYRGIIEKYRLRHYAPLTSYEAIESSALSPQNAPAIARELSNILAFREDHRLADLLGRIILQSADIAHDEAGARLSAVYSTEGAGRTRPRPHTKKPCPWIPAT
jgi:hypothetical protein